jgi:hypothetical protein
MQDGQTAAAQWGARNKISFILDLTFGDRFCNCENDFLRQALG